MNHVQVTHKPSNTSEPDSLDSLQLSDSAESIWVDVIHKMESVYADLVLNQEELEQKNAALEEAQQFISSVLSSMTDVLIACDNAGAILKTNAALEHLTGFSAASLLGRPLYSLFDDKSQTIVRDLVNTSLLESVTDCELNVRCADKSIRPLALNCSCRYDADQKPVGIVLIGRPVGELRRAYEQLKRTQQQLVHSEKMASLGRLVAGVAHELNNPISFVFGNMHALKRYSDRISTYLTEVQEHLDPEISAKLRDELHIDRILSDIGPLVEGTLEGAERVSDIVQDLKRYSGGQREATELIDLTAQINKATDWVMRASRVKPEIHYHLPDALSVETRKGQLHQILVNLVQNAMDALEKTPHPELFVACETSKDSLTIEIRDTGPGIKDSDLPHIFEPFFTNKPVGQGTGLGLYISYGLAQDLGGSLSAYNHHSGGACFSLSIPLLSKDTLET
ncbi:two-component system sensor histidine kinase HupT/HoxJ [Alteromonadaceae bacterium 2753L.S.0a.02]|nr:two-component system sensor histidine kinase HupT/HoxJ [Alteromonadaceae bacterium 2753L.S.0a.02]